MQTLISPQNYVIISIAQKFYETITFKSGVTLYKDTTFHPEESAMLVGKVVGKCLSIIQRADYEGYTELPAVGETILMRYDVVYSYKDQPERNTPIYDNMIRRDGEEYWKCDIQKVFAVKTPEGYRMLNGYIFCDLIEEERSIGDLLVLPEHFRTQIRKDKMRVRYSEHPEAKPGDVIYCTPNVAQLYQIDTEQFYIIKASHLLAADLC